MKRYTLIVFIILNALLSGCSKGPQISPKTMTSLLTEMYLLDQYVGMDGTLNQMSQSMYVYNSTIEKYGYTEDIFLNSLDYYREHPEKLIKILNNVKLSIDSEMYTSAPSDNEFVEDQPIDASDNSNDDATDSKSSKPRKKTNNDDNVNNSSQSSEKKMSKEELKELKDKWK